MKVEKSEFIVMFLSGLRHLEAILTLFESSLDCHVYRVAHYHLDSKATPQVDIN